MQGDSGPPGAPGPQGVSVSMTCVFKSAAYTDDYGSPQSKTIKDFIINATLYFTIATSFLTNACLYLTIVHS